MTTAMTRGVLAPVAVVLLLAVAPLAPIVVFDDAPSGPGATHPAYDERLERLLTDEDTDDAGATTADRRVTVVLKLERGATLPDAVDPDRVYTREGSRLLQAEVPMSAVRELGRHPEFQSVRIRQGRPDDDPRVAGGVSVVRADALHRRGLTGENVSVGIIGSGFRPGDPEVAGSVAAYRTFDADSPDWRHGTAVASVVADTAPGADLHLAAIGEATTRGEYADAVAWLQANDVDVILDAGSYFGESGDGTGDVASVAARAANDTLFVTTAGNYAQRHWAGIHDASDGTGWVTFADGDQGNVLNGGDAFAGRVRVGLRWSGGPGVDGYDLYLLREQFGEDEVVAVAEGGADGAPVAQLDATVPRGRYYVAVRDGNATGVTHVDLFANRRLHHRTPAGSVTAPGTADSVFVVGATHNGSVAAYSSRGGSGSSVDAVAPASVSVAGLSDTNGTSYAAPYAAGIAALLYQRYDMRPATTAAVLRESAVDVGAPGVDQAAGYGRLDALGAYQLTVAWHRFESVNAST